MAGYYDYVNEVSWYFISGYFFVTGEQINFIAKYRLYTTIEYEL